MSKPDADPYDLASPKGPDKRDVYAVGKPAPTGERKDLERIRREGRWCPACGCDLTLVDVPPCPRCERPFIPGDKATYSDEPLEVQHPYWWTSPRLAGALTIILFLLGRSIFNGVGTDTADMLEGSGGRAGVVVGVMTAILIIPWLIFTTFCALIALSEYYNPKLAYCLMIGAGLGVFLSLGMPMIILLMGLIAGTFAGFIWCWLAKF